MTDPSAESLPLGQGVTPMSAAQGPQEGPQETGGERRRIKRQKIKVRKDSGFSLYTRLFLTPLGSKAKENPPGS